MATLHLETMINASITTCFNCSRDIDLHKISTAESKEQAIAGRTTGLIELHEWVTWEAKHLGIRQQLTTVITRMQKPSYFRDEMISGVFKVMWHDHFFKSINGTTIMRDIFHYEVPFGFMGRLIDRIFLRQYMLTLLTKRNAILKRMAESSPH